MSGTQYHIDESLLRELRDESQEVAIIMSQKVLLKQLFQYKYLQEDIFDIAAFSQLTTKEKLLVINAVIVFRLSCIDYIYYFSPTKIDFILNEYLHAYEDFLHIKEHNFIDFEETLKTSYPRAVSWMNNIEAQAKLNAQLKKSKKDCLL